MTTLLNKYTIVIAAFAIFNTTYLTAQKEGTIDIESSQNVKLIIAKKRAYNKKHRKISGYKIQLFYGNEQGAYKVRDRFTEAFPDITTEIKFFSPEWKVWVGAYKTKLEVDRAIKEIKEASFEAIPVITEIKI